MENLQPINEGEKYIECVFMDVILMKLREINLSQNDELMVLLINIRGSIFGFFRAI